MEMRETGGMGMKPKVMVSQCLLGICCRYDGKSVPKEHVCREACARGWIPVCPEILGGLTTPRSPAERVDGRVMNRDGDDVTNAFDRGAHQALELAKLYGVKYAMLKEKSPSCGSGIVYDGTFSGSLTEGYGVTAELFEKNGIKVYGESQLDELINQLKWDEEHDSI